MTPAERRHMRQLTEMIAVFERDAQTRINSPDNRDAAFGYKLKDRAAAIEWAIAQIGARRGEVVMVADTTETV